MSYSTTPETAPKPARATRWWGPMVMIVLLALIALAIAPLTEQMSALAERSNLRLHFDAALFARQSIALKLHVLGAVIALGVGLILFAGPKGRALHRTLGWAWVLAMGLTALSSIFIRGLNYGQFSYIHGLTAFVLVMLPLGVMAARRHDVRLHKRRMTGLFVGGLLVAGALTFLPGRLMWQLFLG